ncbi:MAG: YqiA/YcfP family alpha/beta fold hydrolase [Legionella sp.]|nr:YqiA/YcfP family alpha/beta fold hydrolase [Legionella sp.]
MNSGDFQYMWRGKAMRPLPKSETDSLKPIDIRHKGNQRALLLLHGFSSSPAVYRAIWPELTNYNALVCQALPGHAENLAAFTSVTRDEWLAAARVTCESLINQYETVEVVGLSLGGLLASHLAQEFPIKHLYLLAPALKLTFNMPLAKAAARLLHACGIKQLKNRAGNLFTHTHDELTYKKLPLRTVLELFALIEETQFAVPNCPVDLFLGRHDNVVDSASVQKQFENSKHCNIHWLEHSAHALPLDGDIQSIIQIINQNN